MSTIINARSPYYIKSEITQGITDQADIYAIFDTTSMQTEDGEFAATALQTWFSGFQNDNPSYTGNLYILPYQDGSLPERYLDFPTRIKTGLINLALNSTWPSITIAPPNLNTVDWIAPTDILLLAFVDEAASDYHAFSVSDGFVNQPTNNYFTDFVNFKNDYTNHYNFFKAALYPIVQSITSQGGALVLQSLAAIKGRLLTQQEIDDTNTTVDVSLLLTQNPYEDAPIPGSSPAAFLEPLEDYGWIGFFDKTSPASAVFSGQQFQDDLDGLVTSGGGGAVGALYRLNLYIYSGLLTNDKPAEPNYVISSSPFVGTTYAVFEVSELIRDFIYTEYYSDQTVDAVWVEADIDILDAENEIITTQSSTYLAIDGYGYFPEGINPRQSIDNINISFTPHVLQDNKTVYYYDCQDIIIPVFSEKRDNITSDIEVYWDTADYFWEAANFNWDADINIIDSNNSFNKIQYVVIDQDTVTDGTILTFTATQGNTGGSEIDLIKLKKICEPKYNPISVIFYNKYGALQNLYFSKKSSTTLTTTDSDYDRNTLDFSGAMSYDIYKHTKRRFNVKGNETITVNSDYIEEEFNDVIKQMLLSEQIWIDDCGTISPVKIKTSTFQVKTIVNDKLIQYTIEFEYAYDKINNVR